MHRSPSTSECQRPGTNKSGECWICALLMSIWKHPSIVGRKLNSGSHSDLIRQNFPCFMPFNQQQTVSSVLGPCDPFSLPLSFISTPHSIRPSDPSHHPSPSPNLCSFLFSPVASGAPHLLSSSVSWTLFSLCFLDLTYSPCLELVWT